VQPLGSSQHFMEPEGSLPSSQELSTHTFIFSPRIHSSEVRQMVKQDIGTALAKLIFFLQGVIFLPMELFHPQSTRRARPLPFRSSWFGFLRYVSVGPVC
jgi:hypothetical protein